MAHDAASSAREGARPETQKRSRRGAQPPASPDGRTHLADLTTIGLGGSAPSVTVARSAAEVAATIGAADRAAGGGCGALVLGGGSNLIVADAGVAVPVVRIAVPGVRIDSAGDDGIAGAAGITDGFAGAGAGEIAIATIGAGRDWDGVVEELVADGWAGVEALSGIPGSAGATPVQNVGAYGTEIADVLIDVEMYDRVRATMRTVTRDELRFGYRSSMLRGTDRGVVTSVRLRLNRTPAPVRYPELARVLGIAAGAAAPPAAVREAVLQLRRSKGMVLDAADADTRSVGSFFTNPILDAADLPAVLTAIRNRLGPDVTVPQYPAGSATKLSAAWLIEHAGFPRGYPLVANAAWPDRRARPDARITISTKHALALTNRGGGSTAELLALAREIRDGVRDAFGVVLHAEPVLVGVELG